MSPTTAVISVRPLRARPWYAHVRAAEDLFVATTGAVRHDIEGPSGWVSDARWARRALRTARRWPSTLTPAPTAKADLAVMWTSDLGDVGELLDVADAQSLPIFVLYSHIEKYGDPSEPRTSQPLNSLPANWASKPTNSLPS